jgi:hypothetical protein
MTIFVSYVPDEAIERDAEALLTEYSRARGIVIEPPIAVEDIVEKYLKLRVEFDDLHRLFNAPRKPLQFEPDILGAIYFGGKRVVIDESLDPEEYPTKEGRYRYTLAHEGAHWRLHHGLIGKESPEGVILDGSTAPSVVCRSSEAKARIEIQADRHASCVLMPRALVFGAWEEAFPDRKPRILQPGSLTDHPFAVIAHDEFSESEDQALEFFARPLAERFLVSPIAMRIRLEKLGLLHRKFPPTFLPSGRP